METKNFRTDLNCNSCVSEVHTAPNDNSHHHAEAEQSTFKTYYPLILIFGYLVMGVGVMQINADHLSAMQAMNHFMGGFFIVFSFFKLLDLKGFAEGYSTYDIVAKKFYSYGYIYPFIELALGLAYLSEIAPVYNNAVTILVMSISSIGVIQSLLKKNKIQCACLGTVFKLPMTQVTLFEDLLMVGMAIAAIVLR